MRLEEAIFNEGLQPSAVDRTAGVIRGVKVLGRESKHGRTYSDKALRDAAGLYEGVKVNIDHPRRDGKGGSAIDRSFTEAIGELRGANVRQDGVYADLHYAKAHPYAELLAESAERFPKQFGLSHVADGDEKAGPGGKRIVESINRVVSADVVGRPATNAGLFESEDDMAKPKTKTVKQILESAPAGDFKDRLTRLVEMEAVDPSMAIEMPSESGGSTEPADEIKAALKRSGHAIVDEMIDGNDSAGGLKKLKELLKLGDKVDSMGKEKEAPPGGGEGKVEEGLREVQSKLRLIEAENAILKSGRKATDELVEAVASLPTPEKRKKLIESFPEAGKKAAARGRKGFRTGSILTESEGDDDRRGGSGGSGSYDDLKSERKWREPAKK